MTSFIAALRAFEEECNKRLDEIESHLASVETQNLDNNLTVSTTDIYIDPALLEQILSSEQFKELGQETQDFETKISNIIIDSTEILKQKASTKRMTEKANRNYVDSSFQKYSTNVSAFVNQRISEKQVSLEKEMDIIEEEIDALKERAVKEFNEIKNTIHEIKMMQQAKKEEEKEKNIGNQTRARTMRKKTTSLLRKDAKLLRPKSAIVKQSSVKDLCIGGNKIN